MNIVHIIGNGFDLNQGLPTSYAHFYEYYLQLVPKADDPESVKRFRSLLREKLLEKRSEDWTDLEQALGKLTAEFKKAVDYEKAYRDVYSHLMEYLNMVNQYSMVEKFENPEKTLYTDLYHPWQHLKPADWERVESIIPVREDFRISVISFNYTDTFYRVSELSNKLGSTIGRYQNSNAYFDSIKHVHHTLKGNDIILGVDNLDQIENPLFRENERLQNYLVKPQTNSGMGTLIDRECRTLIENAHLICIYGTSVGITDKTWWQIISKHFVKNNHVCIIYFPFEKNISDLLNIDYYPACNDHKRHVMEVMGLKEQESSQRIFVNLCNLPNRRNIFNNTKRADLKENFEDVMAKIQKEGKIVKPENKKGPFDLEIMPPVAKNPLFEPRIYHERTLHYEANQSENILKKYKAKN